MALTKRFTDYAVKLHTLTAQAAAAKYVDGVSDIALNSNLRTRVEGGDGLVYRTFGALVAGAPAARLTASQVKTFLDECGLEGMLIDKDATHPGVVFYFQKYKLGGTRETAATAVHHSTTIENGILVPRTLDVEAQGAARISAEAIAIKSGAIDPFVFKEDDTLPSAVYPAAEVEHTIGKVDLNGTTLDGVKRASIDFGIALIVDPGGDSEIYPSHVAIDVIDPTITLVTEHIDLTTTLTEDGLYHAAETVIVYLRKRAEGGTFVADGTAEHIKFTLGKCRVEWQSISGKPKEMAVLIKPWYTTGATPKSPLAINTASAIT